MPWHVSPSMSYFVQTPVVIYVSHETLQSSQGFNRFMMFSSEAGGSLSLSWSWKLQVCFPKEMFQKLPPNLLEILKWMEMATSANNQ